MLKRFVTAALTLALLVTSLAFVATPAKAQTSRTSTAAPGAWRSAILIQNVGTGNADVTVDFYDKDGVIKESYTANALGANKSVTILVFNNPQLDGNTTCCDLASGQYSAVVSSTQPVVASVQTSSFDSASAPWTSFAYEGVSAQNTSSTLYFPGNYNNYYGFYSEIVLQNAGGADTTASIEFFNATTGAPIAINGATKLTLGAVPQNRAVTFAMADIAGLPSGNTNGIFGARVTSSGSVPLAGIANAWATTPTNKASSYNAFTSGTNEFFAPILTRKYYGFISALTIQNVDTIDATVSVVFSNGARKDNILIKPGAANVILTENDDTLPSGNQNGTFAARVTSTGGKVVGLVGYSRPANLNNNKLIGDYANYNCPSVASTEVNVPSVLSDYYGLFTNVSVQNTSATETTDITLEYSTGQTWTITGVAPNAVVNFLHLDPNDSATPPIKNPLAAVSSVSAVAKSSNANAKLVAVVQHNTEPSLTRYRPEKTPSDYLHVFTATPR